MEMFCANAAKPMTASSARNAVRMDFKVLSPYSRSTHSTSVEGGDHSGSARRGGNSRFTSSPGVPAAGMIGLHFALPPMSNASNDKDGRPLPTGMRKGLTSYGDEGFSLFLRKAFIK